jgi:hypothetical protein
VGSFYIVKEGECLSSLAQKFGFKNLDIIYNHPENRELKKIRPNPNLLLPGDEVFIPESEPKSVSANTNYLHHFKLSRPKTRLKILLSGLDNEPVRNRKYILHIDNLRFEGVSKYNGLIEHEISPFGEEGILMIYPEDGKQGADPIVLKVKLGHLDPIDTLTGIQARLNNLGFNAGPVNGIMEPLFVLGIKLFQQAYGLPIDGKPDSKTQLKLKQVYGC